ncbi:hypothetical protein SEA_JEMERALD_60 [Microbacterium phage Jemerald]|nr:hypothetical protein SEA_JUICER_60 [Microbacterium phage Juicer]WNO27299.1 hypothetical protein SEA_JEMERALD_60 [Microbacterium phage Jemerald]
MALAVKELQAARNRQLGQIEELSEDTRRYNTDVNEARQKLQVAEARLSNHTAQMQRHRDAVAELDKAIAILESAQDDAEED